MGVFSGRAKAAKYSAPRSITAAAAPVRLRNRSELEQIRQRNSTSHAWQREAWQVYRNLGEVSFAFNVVANALSRVRIHAAVNLNPDEPPTEITDAVSVEKSDGEQLGAPGGIDPALAIRAREFMAQLNQGSGVSSLLKSYALNQQVAGECYLCLFDDKWTIRSTFELLVDPGGLMRVQPSVTVGQQGMPRELPASATVARMWSADPMYSADPDCSLRPVLFLCEQLILLNRMINNTVRSRMNAGILKVAASIVAASRTPGAEGNVDDPDGAEELSPFEVDLHAAMTAPIADDSASAGVVPLVATVPDELVGPGIEWVQLSRDVDEHMIAYAENVLQRILQGINVPKDIITGFQNVRFSNAAHTSEDLFKQSVEPLALSFVDAITEIFLRPLLQADALVKGWDKDQVAKIVCWYDPSEIVTRPDRGADADAGWDRGALSDDAWRQAHGFSAQDAPSEDEVAKRALFRTAQLPPNLVDFAARKLYPEVFQGAGPLVTQSQAGMGQAATAPLHSNGNAPNGQQPGTRNPANQFHVKPAGTDDQEPSPNGVLPPRATAP